MVPKKLGWSVAFLMLLALVAGACAPAATPTPPSPTPTPAPKTETPTLQPSPTATFTPTAIPTPDFKKLEEEVISKYFPTLKQILELPENKGAYVDWGSVEEYNIASEENGVLFKVYGLRKIPCGIFGKCSDYGDGKILTFPKPFNKENRFSNREWLQSFPGYGGSRAYIEGKEIVVEDTDNFIILYYTFESKFSDRQVEALTEEEIKEFLNKIKELAKLQNAK